MKNQFLISLFILFGVFSLNAQSNHFYYYKGQKIYLTLDRNKLNIITNSQFEKNTISNLNIKDYNLSTSENLKHPIIII